ncbi:uncharacterized protein LOC110700013 isoform X2 [Chenopodium quinoa]|uniref:uncharacterized protein LOC110700013 isoform X2 n=1 Tax=Chenopodium quinoa TaxID=63459 RepID=UPI000B77899A|nr:uncharacterized protein LOC110700013 isoform X2 [Chenopodium quinoa]
MSKDCPLMRLLPSIVAAFEGLKSLKPILKLLYYLICSSSSYEVCQDTCNNSAAENGLNLKPEDVITLSSILFKELHKRLLSSSDYASMDQDVGLDVTKCNGNDSREELLLLLRCCVLLVRLHPYDQMLTEQFKAAVALLHRLSDQGILTAKTRGSIGFSKLNTSQSAYGNCTKSYSPDLKSKSSNLYMRFLLQMLEVYLDEIFADRPFRECIAISDSISSTCQNLAVWSSTNIESVLEISAAHFLLSFSVEDVLQTFIESLIWTEKPSLFSPEVSLAVASSLINHPVMMSAPLPLLSHLISLVSEVIGIWVSPEKVVPEFRCVNIYLSTFNDSVNLYCEHMSKLMTGISPGRIVQRHFESHFHSVIYDKINFMLVDLDNAWRERSTMMFNMTISSVAIDAISYIETNIYIVDKTYRDNLLSFLCSLIARLISVEVNEVLLQKFKEMAMQDFCLLASILKLMSCSLLQATHCCNENLSCLISLLKRKDVIPCHSSQADLMSSFAQYNLHLPVRVQQFIINALKPYVSEDEEYELFMHFSSLLSLSIVSGLHILVCGCLFFMLVLLNALALRSSSIKSGTESPACVFSQTTVISPVEITPKTGFSDISRKKSSLRVASNFRRERRKLYRDYRASEFSGLSDEETCNGENFLKCLTKNRKDIADLSDFIECKPWRDYNARLFSKSRIQFRRLQESARRLRLKKMQVHNSVKRGGKRKCKGKSVKVQSI